MPHPPPCKVNSCCRALSIRCGSSPMCSREPLGLANVCFLLRVVRSGNSATGPSRRDGAHGGRLKSFFRRSDAVVRPNVAATAPMSCAGGETTFAEDLGKRGVSSHTHLAQLVHLLLQNLLVAA